MERISYNIKYGQITSGSEVVALSVAKSNSNIEHSESDSFFKTLLDASVQEAEDYISNPLLKRSATIMYSGWSTPFTFPIEPVISITAFGYYDQQGQYTELVEDTDYKYLNGEVVLLNDTFPSLYDKVGYPIKIELIVGYENDEMPKQAVGAVLMRFSHKELFREDVPTSYERAFHSALRPLKNWD